MEKNVTIEHLMEMAKAINSATEEMQGTPLWNDCKDYTRSYFKQNKIGEISVTDFAKLSGFSLENSHKMLIEINKDFFAAKENPVALEKSSYVLHKTPVKKGFFYEVKDQNGKVISSRTSKNEYVACSIDGRFYFGRLDLVGKGDHGRAVKNNHSVEVAYLSPTSAQEPEVDVLSEAKQADAWWDGLAGEQKKTIVKKVFDAELELKEIADNMLPADKLLLYNMKELLHDNN